MHKSPLVEIEQLIYIIRGYRVMLDRDLASLYGVETRTLNQSVRRNVDRFPDDFMFQLTDIEEESLRSQIVISKEGRGGKRYRSMAFTELGIAMLSSVLKSDQAIKTNIAIMRTFFELKRLLKDDDHLAKKVEALEKNTTQLFKLVFFRLDQLEDETPILRPDRRKIGI
jgi:hypothetical protein